jgi:hypothetical protein
MMLPVEEVCGGKGLIDKCPSSSLYLAFLVITDVVLSFPQGHPQGIWSLRRGEVLTETSQILSIKWVIQGKHWWTQSAYRVHRTEGDQAN